MHADGWRGAPSDHSSRFLRTRETVDWPGWDLYLYHGCRWTVATNRISPILRADCWIEADLEGYFGWRQEGTVAAGWAQTSAQG